jgi:hypothetical protein
LLIGIFVGPKGFASALPEGMDWSGTSSLREALQRISARTGKPLPRQAWPLSTDEITKFLLEVKESDALTPSDSLALTEFLVSSLELKRWSRPDDGTFLALNPRLQVSMRRDSGESYRSGSLGGELYGTLGGQIQWYSQASISTEWSDDYVFFDRYTVADGEPSGVPFGDDNRNGRYKKRTFARYVAYAQSRYKWISVKYGRDRIQHGPGEWTGLSTSLATPPWTLLDVRIVPFDWLSVQSTLMEALPTDPYASIRDPRYFDGDAQKWMHVQRFEIRALAGLTLAFQDMVIYPTDSGGINPAYLLPLTPIFFTQDLNGNKDNAAMQFDARLDRIPCVSLWGAFFIDDLDGPTTIFDNHWLNRWAALVGFRLVSPWKGFDADFTAEVSVVRPWTYTGGRESAYTFSHYGIASGSEGGPDSRSSHARFLWRPFRAVEMGPEFSLQEKGTGRQARLGTVHSDMDGDKASLLEHAFRTWTLSGSATWEPWLGKHVSGTIGYAWSDSTRLAGVRWSLGISTGW